MSATVQKWKRCWSKSELELEAVVSQDGGPERLVWVWRMRNDPEAFVGMVNDGDGFLAQGGHRPVLSEEVQGAVGMEAALMVERQMEVEQCHRGQGLEAGAFILEGFVPGVVGGQAGGAADVVLIMPVNVGLKELVGRREVGDALVGQESDPTFLKGVEAAFDFAFGLGIGRHAVRDAQRGEGTLKLRVSIQAVGGGAMAEERKAVGIKRGGRAVGFDGRAQMGEVAPGRVAGDKGGGDDFTGVIVGGEDERGIGLGGPPGMGRGVVLPEFADVGALPAAARFGAGPLGRAVFGKVLTDISGDGGAGPMEVEATGQFVSQKGEIERLAVRQDVGQELVGGFGPGGVMVAAGAMRRETALVEQPLVAQLIKAGAPDHQAFGGRLGVECAVVEGGEDLLDVECGEAMSQLLFFIAATIADWGRCPQAPEVYRFEAPVDEPGSTRRPSLRVAALGRGSNLWLNRWNRRRSGCASAGPYPASEPLLKSRLPPVPSSLKSALLQKATFGPTIRPLLLQQFCSLLS